MAKYSAEQLRQMLAKGQAMKNPAGDPSYPIGDEEDLGNAIHAVGRGGASANAIRRYIMGRARAMGKSSMIPDTWNSDGSLNTGSTRSEPETYLRTFQLSDISVRTDSDGRTVDAYASVFNQPALVHDQDGTYEEVIDPAAFNRAIEHQHRSGRRFPVLFNHGMTIFHTPDPDGGIPIGVADEVRADEHGLFTRSRYHNSPRADQVLEAIQEGSITAYSFGGQFLRSSPTVPHGGFRKDSRGKTPTVRRIEASLREFGPATFPVYQDAAIVGVRAEQVATMLGHLSPLELDRLRGMFGTPSDDGPAAGDPPEGHSTRSPKQEIRARYAQFLSRKDS